MKRIPFLNKCLAWGVLAIPGILLGAPNSASKPDPRFRLLPNGVWVGETTMVPKSENTEDVPLRFTTDRYNNEALRLILQEANAIARDLNLAEKLPINKDDVLERFVVPYGTTKHRPMLGKIYTQHYGYFVSVGYKMSYVEGTRQDENCRKWMEQCKWPISRIDTNAAYQLATQWLAAASMDVSGLNRDCQVQIELERFWNGANPKKESTFVPIYDVVWMSPQKKGQAPHMTAAIRLFSPTKTLVSLRVEEARYILRPPLIFTNLDVLLATPKSK